MILSASRRTDIPNYYSEWFYNRIKEGLLYVQNPMNPHQVSRINISPETVDGIVFWTKNPKPMLARLDELSAFPYYFQFTLTGYGRDIEQNVPHKREKMIPVFQELSKKIGRKRVIWRYDPILFTQTYTPEYHMHAFEQIACALSGYTDKCIISFVDIYTKNKKSMEAIGAYNIEKNVLVNFTGKLGSIAKANNMKTASCAESIDLSAYGIEHNCCIDKALIEELAGHKIQAGKDKNQRPECGCAESVDVGTYNTCRNGCIYCYAGSSPESIMKNCSKYDPVAPILCGVLTKDDHIKERKT